MEKPRFTAPFHWSRIRRGTAGRRAIVVADLVDSNGVTVLSGAYDKIKRDAERRKYVVKNQAATDQQVAVLEHS